MAPVATIYLKELANGIFTLIIKIIATICYIKI